MILTNLKKDIRGFTLIELLLVIVIIGILTGILLTVIDPAGQQRKARETVLRSNVEKGCLALHACGISTVNSNNCDTNPELGISDAASPQGSNYYLTDAATPADADSSANPSVTAPVRYRGVLGTCRFQCGYDFSAPSPFTYAGQDIMEIPVGSTCIIGVQ